MIYGFERIKSHPLFAIHRELRHFFFRTLSFGQFGPGLFNKRFRPVLDACPRLRDILQKIFTELKSGNHTTAQDFLNVFDNNNKIARLCGDTTFSLLQWRSANIKLNDSLTELAEYLYEELPLRQSLLEAIDNGGYRNYYKKFREVNKGTVCPFCGIENLPDYFEDERDSTLPRACYDHYLCRSSFPLSAINFENLIPTCKFCNEHAKGSKLVIFSEVGNRRKAHYPFNKPVPFDFTLSQIQQATIEKKARWQVNITSRKPADSDKVATWLSVYNIEDRWTARIEGRAKFWESFTLQELLPAADDLEKVRCGIRDKQSKCGEEFIKNEVDGQLKVAFFDYLVELDDRRLKSAVEALRPIAASQPTSLLSV